jgi:hypothetical protein
MPGKAGGIGVRGVDLRHGREPKALPSGLKTWT